MGLNKNQVVKRDNPMPQTRFLLQCMYLMIKFFEYKKIQWQGCNFL